MATYLSSAHGAVFIQIDGPNTATAYLGCHDMGDIAEPMGDIARTFCPDPGQPGKYNVALRTQGAPGEVTFDISFPLGSVVDYLEEARRTGCSFPVYVNYSTCDRPDNFLRYAAKDRGEVLQDCSITNIVRTTPATRNVDGGAPGEAGKTVSFSSKAIEEYFMLVDTRRATIEDQILRDIAFCNKAQCQGPCGAAQHVCDEGVIVCDFDGGVAIADVLFTTDAGVTWAGIVCPYLITENVSSVVCFPMDMTTTRVIIARGTPDAGAADVAWTDDSGANWNIVDVGATNTEFIPSAGGGGLFSLGQNHIWACTDTGAGAAGAIYFSGDAGLTWTLQTAAATDALNYIRFLDKDIGLCVGDTNEIQYSDDGGTHWTALVGPVAQNAVNCTCCEILDENRYFIGYLDGTLWYTQDGGTNWAQRVIPAAFAGGGTTTIYDIMAVDDYCLWMATHSTTAAGAAEMGAIYRSINGGEAWESWGSDAALPTGYRALWACSYNKAFAVGDVATTSYIAEVGES